MLPLLSQAQVTITGTANTGYYLETADGDTLQLSGTTPFYNTYRSALEDAIMYSGDYGMTVYVRSNMNERVNADFGYYDEPITIYETDTVYVTQPADTVTVFEEVFVTSPPDTVIEYVTVPPDTVTVTETETITVTEFVTDTVFVDVPGETQIDTVTVTETITEVITDTLFVDVPGETQIDTVTVFEMQTDTVTVTEEVYIELPADTVYAQVTEYIELPPDTIYVPLDYYASPDSLPLYTNLGSHLEGPLDSDTTTVTIAGIADPNRIKEADVTWVCRDESESFEYERLKQYGPVIHGSFLTTCKNQLDLSIHLTGPADTVTVNETWPAFAFTNGVAEPTGYINHFENTAFFDSTWTLIWGNVVPTFSNDVLVLENPTRNVSRLQWNTIPMHRDIRVRVTEIIDSTHSTGIHMSMRTSQIPQENSVETYINNNGFGISIFTNGTWSNPVNFPFQWEYGVPIDYIVELVGDTIRAKAWTSGFPEPTEWWTYQSDVIGAHPDGTFSIGSTGQGIYLIDSIEIDILDP